jgi:RNA polymerase sigma-70 factor (ECF subfamily)
VEVCATERERDFHACYVELYPRLAAYVCSLTRDRETAHDLAQETFARLFDRWSRVDDPTPYAYRVATNLVRRTWRHSQLDARALRITRRDHEATMAADPTTPVDLRHVVDALPRRYRQIVLLHYYADLPLPAIADALGRPVGTVKRQLSEARGLLATALEGAR